MRLLHVISSVNPKGGGPIEGIKQLQKPLQDLGVHVEIACCDAPDAPWLTNSDLRGVHALGPARMQYAYAPRLKKWLNENASHFDAVIVEGLWQYHSLAVRSVLVNTNTPYFVFTHGMLGPWFKKMYPIKHLKKWLYWPWAEYRVLRDAQAVIFTCEEERILAQQSFWLYQANEAVSGLGTSNPPKNQTELKYEFFDKFPQLKEKRIFLFLGRIHEIKGCDLLLKAFSQVAGRDEHLHLVMAGPDQTGWVNVLKKQTAQLGIDHRVTWTGMLQGDCKWGAFYSAEVFCLPSHHENFGIVLAEALACGKPVLISNKVNIWREIETDGAGIVQDDTIDGTVNLLTQWLDLSMESKNQMQQAAYRCFESRFHIDRVAEKLIGIIQEHTNFNSVSASTEIRSVA